MLMEGIAFPTQSSSHRINFLLVDKALFLPCLPAPYHEMAHHGGRGGGAVLQRSGKWSVPKGLVSTLCACELGRDQFSFLLLPRPTGNRPTVSQEDERPHLEHSVQTLATVMAKPCSPMHGRGLHCAGHCTEQSNVHVLFPHRITGKEGTSRVAQLAPLHSCRIHCSPELTVYVTNIAD